MSKKVKEKLVLVKPGTWLSLPITLTDEEVKQRVESWKKRHEDCTRIDFTRDQMRFGRNNQSEEYSEKVERQRLIELNKYSIIK